MNKFYVCISVLIAIFANSTKATRMERSYDIASNYAHGKIISIITTRKTVGEKPSFYIKKTTTFDKLGRIKSLGFKSVTEFGNFSRNTKYTYSSNKEGSIEVFEHGDNEPASTGIFTVSNVNNSDNTISRKWTEELTRINSSAKTITKRSITFNKLFEELGYFEEDFEIKKDGRTILKAATSVASKYNIKSELISSKTEYSYLKSYQSSVLVKIKDSYSYHYLSYDKNKNWIKKRVELQTQNEGTKIINVTREIEYY
jgi:hypothetical protein